MKLTRDIRDKIFWAIMNTIPNVDYGAKIAPLVRDILVSFMPPEVRAVYDKPEMRKYLNACSVVVRNGVSTGRAIWLDSDVGFYNAFPDDRIEIRASQSVLDHLKKGTLNHSLTEAVINSGFYEDHVKQSELRSSVEKRIRHTLESVTTTNRLYDVLEPELHHLIPKEGAKIANLPANVAPVVDDLRKLGAILPSAVKTPETA